METLQKISRFLSKSAQASSEIRASRLSPEQVQLLFSLVDVSRKNSLDLSDIYHLVGDVTQAQLFAIFKWLDHSRSGDITLADFQATLADPAISSAQVEKVQVFTRFYAAVDSLKAKQVLQEKLKSQFGFSQATMRNVYQRICQLVKTDYPSVSDLCALLARQTSEWKREDEEELRSLVGGSLNEKKFIEVFAIQPDAIAPQQTPVRPPSVLMEARSVSISKERLQQAQCEKYAQYAQYAQYVESPGNPYEAKQNEPMERRRNFVATEEFKSIQQRREELRRESQERRRMIDNLMQKKMETVKAVDVTTDSWQDKFSHLNRTSSNLKKVTVYGSYDKPSPSRLVLESKGQAESYLGRFPKENSFSKETVPAKERILGTFTQTGQNWRNMEEARQDSFQSYLNRSTFGKTLGNSRFVERSEKRDWAEGKREYERGAQLDINSLVSKYRPASRGGDRVGGDRGMDSCQGGKESITRRAEEEAIRKIEQIERRARAKMLQRKGSAGRWLNC